MSVDFSQLTNVSLDTIKRPPVKPPGTYTGVIMDYKFGESSQKKTPFVQFAIGNVQPGNDIQPDQLKDSDGEAIDLTKWKPTTDFYLTPDSLYRIKEFIESLGINSSGRSLSEVLPETRNQPVMFTCTMQASQDGTGFFNRVNDVKAAA